MNDPISPLTAPPPRYLLESDSSDEEGQGWYAGGGGPSLRPRPKEVSEVTLKWTTTTQEDYKSVVVGVGQAGRYLRRKLGVSAAANAVLEVEQAGRTIGTGWEEGSSLLLVLEEGVDHDIDWAVASSLVQQVKTLSWSIVSSYLPSLYIPDPHSPHPQPTPSDSPIRYLHITKPASISNTGDYTQPFASPNFITGLPASLASLITHPSSPIDTSSTSVTVLLFPLPLSYVPLKWLVSSFEGTVADISTAIASHSKDLRSKWDEDDDEPYTGIGMGGRRYKPAGELKKEDIGSMYM